MNKNCNMEMVRLMTLGRMTVAVAAAAVMISSAAVRGADLPVKEGQKIAFMGDSGSVNGSKLHFEIWGKGQKLDPEKWLAVR